MSKPDTRLYNDPPLLAAICTKLTTETCNKTPIGSLLDSRYYRILNANVNSCIV